MKIFILAVTLLCMPFMANAQKEVGKFSIQPKVGINVSGLTGNPEVEAIVAMTKPLPSGELTGPDDLPEQIGIMFNDAKNKIGFVVGAEAEYQASRQFALSAGVLYSMQGAEFSAYHSDKMDITDVRMKLGYINIPIIANYYVAKGLALRAGLQPGFCVSKDAKANLSARVEEGQYVAGAMSKPDVSTLDLSVPVGISYEYKGVTVGATYNIGVTNISGDSRKPSFRNNVFQFTLGYKIGI